MEVRVIEGRPGSRAEVWLWVALAAGEVLKH